MDKAFTKDLGQKNPVITFDEDLYSKAKQIQQAVSPELDHIVIRFGGFHIAKNFLSVIGKCQPGVGLVVRVAAWDPRVLSSSPVGCSIKIHQEVDSASHPSEVGKMSTSVVVRGTLHQRHSCVPTNDATSSHRLHSIERMESSLFGRWYSTHINMRWERRGSRSQRYSWGCGEVRAGHGE